LMMYAVYIHMDLHTESSLGLKNNILKKRRLKKEKDFYISSG
jgi:hypothetical protein